MPPRYARFAGINTIVCAPVAAGGHWFGVIFADRGGGDTFELDEDTHRSGYIDGTGRVVIPPRFEPYAGAEPFDKGAALVTIDGLCGAIDRRGRMIVPTGYDHCYRLSDGSILAGAEAGAPPLEPFLGTAPPAR